ncbi:MAG: glycosyltransferase family 39 protein [Treponema sp.]|nr:glycosyltransferase family 39 protein [Treponema sp.]
MYSACVASNPNRPFLSAFGDPGNPPLYFILLRLWFIVFGWSGESGRMLSVVLGTASLLSFYVLAKHFAGAKAALLAAFLMAANTRLIDQSQQTRGYILQVLLVPIVMYRFSLFLENQKPANLILYILSAALLVNTHYYGVLFALAVFCFFVYSEVSRKCFTWKRTAPFLLGNAVIALSLLPFFLLTALREALLNGGFNTWIPKPGLAWKAALPLFAILFALYVSAGKTWLKTKMPDPRFRLLDFAVFTAAVVFILALAISLFRPVFVMRYFPLLIPLAYAAGAALLGSLPRADSRTGKALYLAGVYAALLLGMETRPGGTGGRWDVFHEAQAYVSIDSDSHPEYKSAEMSPLWDPKLYGLTALPPFAPGGHYGAVYFNPVHEHVSDDDRYFLMVKAGIDPGKILRIRINEKRSVFKAYL